MTLLKAHRVHQSFSYGGCFKRSQGEHKFNAVINLNYRFAFLNQKNLDFSENMFLKLN